MAAPVVTMQQLIEAGAHFGHQTHRWNPKMAPFIFGTRNNIHILDLAQTVPATVELVLVSVIFMFAVAIPLGVVTAHYRNRTFDYVGRFLSLTGVTIPSFLFAITLQLLARLATPLMVVVAVYLLWAGAWAVPAPEITSVPKSNRRPSKLWST